MTALPAPHPAPTAAACGRAAAYSARHRGVALVIRWNGQTLLEEYANGGRAELASPIASGTKSLAGLVALAAVADGILDLDEPVAASLDEWRNDPGRSAITPRQLLQLVSGLAATSRPGQTLDYQHAIETPATAPPGQQFRYDPAPFQVFGEVLRRRLSHCSQDPALYLETRLLDPIGARIARWHRTREGYPNLSAGVSMTAADWTRVGELIVQNGAWQDRELLPETLLNQCFLGTPANPAYGLTWWLKAHVPPHLWASLPLNELGLEPLDAEPDLPADLVFAAGAAKQRLYLSRQRRLVIARQARRIAPALSSGEPAGFSDRQFLRLLFERDR